MKISSEDAGSITLTPVVVQWMPLRELVERIVGVTGNDAGRVHETLLRGTIASGASRLRWQGWDAEMPDLMRLLSTLPAADPSRVFLAASCSTVVLYGKGLRLELQREAANARRFLRRRTYWMELMEAVASAGPSYVDYSHKKRADVYQVRFAPHWAHRLVEARGLLRYPQLSRRLAGAVLTHAELYVVR